MTDSFLPPSIDPAQRRSLVGTIEFVKTKMLQEIDDMLPARVIAYDRTKNRASVQILITMVNTLNQNVIRAQIASVPVVQLGGGGFVLSFPLNTGDLGWIKASDVDMSLFLQNLNLSPPNTRILHKFDSAVFIPDTMFKNVVIDGEDSANVVLQTLDGTVRIAVWEDKVKVTAPRVEVVAPETEITASTSTTITSPNIYLNGHVSGNNGADFTGTVTATVDVLANTVSLHNHVHPDPQGGNTGPPIP